MTREVAVVSPDDPLLVAARRMHDDKITCVVVDLGDPKRGYGILTQKDLVQRIADIGPCFPGATIREEMTSPCVTLTSDYDLATALRLMYMVGVRRAPVVDGGELVGLLSFTDIFRWAMTRLDQAAA